MAVIPYQNPATLIVAIWICARGVIINQAIGKDGVTTGGNINTTTGKPIYLIAFDGAVFNHRGGKYHVYSAAIFI
jgi:hypothetical protein